MSNKAVVKELKIMLFYVSFSRQSDRFLSGLNIDVLKREETTTLL